MLQHVLVLVVVDCQSDSNMLKSQHSVAFFALCNGKVTVDNVSQNNIPEGYAGRKQCLHYSN